MPPVSGGNSENYGVGIMMFLAGAAQVAQGIENVSRKAEELGDRGSKSVAKVEDAFQRLYAVAIASQQFTQYGQAIQNWGTGVLGVLYKVGASVIKTANMFEILQNRLKIGFREAADVALEKAKKIAATTPFMMQEVVDLAASLKIFDVDPFEVWTQGGKEAQSVLLRLGDLAGGTMRSLDWVIWAVRNWITGYYRSFIMRFDIGMETMKKAVEGAGFNWDLSTPRKRFESLMTFISIKFEGAMSNLARTLQGIKSNVIDVFTIVQGEIGKAFFFPAVKKSLQEIQDYLQRLEQTGDALRFARSAGQALGKLFMTVKQLAAPVVAFVKGLIRFSSAHPNIAATTVLLAAMGATILILAGRLLFGIGSIMGFYANLAILTLHLTLSNTAASGATASVFGLGTALKALALDVKMTTAAFMTSHPILAWIGIIGVLVTVIGTAVASFFALRGAVDEANKAFTDFQKKTGAALYKEQLKALDQISGLLEKSSETARKFDDLLARAGKRQISEDTYQAEYERIVAGYIQMVERIRSLDLQKMIGTPTVDAFEKAVGIGDEAAIKRYGDIIAAQLRRVYADVYKELFSSTTQEELINQASNLATIITERLEESRQMEEAYARLKEQKDERVATEQRALEERASKELRQLGEHFDARDTAIRKIQMHDIRYHGKMMGRRDALLEAEKQLATLMKENSTKMTVEQEKMLDAMIGQVDAQGQSLIVQEAMRQGLIRNVAATEDNTTALEKLNSTTLPHIIDLAKRFAIAEALLTGRRPEDAFLPGHIPEHLGGNQAVPTLPETIGKATGTGDNNIELRQEVTNHITVSGTDPKAVAQEIEQKSTASSTEAAIELIKTSLNDDAQSLGTHPVTAPGL